jgi:hypothetical protein
MESALDTPAAPAGAPFLVTDAPILESPDAARLPRPRPAEALRARPTSADAAVAAAAQPHPALAGHAAADPVLDRRRGRGRGGGRRRGPADRPVGRRRGVAARLDGRILDHDPPPDWERRPGSADARSLALGAPVAAGPADQTDAGLLAGTLPATAVPASPAIARPLDPTPPRADLVRLGRLPAYRYEGLRRPGTDRVATLYVIPRRSDSLAIACFAPQAEAQAFLAGCAASATTLVPAGAAGTARDSLERYLDRAGAVVNRLGASRSKGRRALARAQTSKAQALAAKQLVGGYSRAAARLGRIRGGGPAAAAVRPLIRDLRGTARAYRRLAVAAAKGAPGSYNAARRSIRSGEAAIQRRIATL